MPASLPQSSNPAGRPALLSSASVLDELTRRLNRFPRIPLASYPTPIEPLPRLGAEIGRELFVKRDDQIGPGLGGNKIRKLEFLLGQALKQGYKRVATFGGLQSNHVRLTAAAANRFGLETHIFYFQPRPARLAGNLLLNHILGAKMHFLPFGESAAPNRTIEAAIRLVRLVAQLRLRRHYFIPVGGHSCLGSLGYVQAAAEIHAQAQQRHLSNPILVLAAGSGGTLAGLLAGFAILNSPIRILAVDVGRLWKNFPDSIARLASDTCQYLGYAKSFTLADVPLIENRFVGQRYGIPSPQGQEAVHRAAHQEGLLLDPVYTAKAFAGLLHLAQNRDPRLGSREPLIFLHTGGHPALFAFDNL